MSEKLADGLWDPFKRHGQIGNGTSGSGVTVVDDDGSHGQNGATGSASFTATGLYSFEVIYYDHNPNGTGATGNTTGAHDDVTGIDPSANNVVFLHAVPEPASIAVLSLGGIGILTRRRRT